MDVTWWVGVLPSGVENVQTVASGSEETREAAAEAAVDALVVVAADRGRQEYRLRVAGTELMVLPGLTPEGDLDLVALSETWHQMWHET